MKFLAKKGAFLILSVMLSVFSVQPANAYEEVGQNQSQENIEISLGEGVINPQGEVVVEDSELGEDFTLGYENKLFEENTKTQAKVNYLYGADRYQTAVKVSQAGWKNGSDTVVVVGGDNTLNGIVATPLASTYNAPILITQSKSLNKDTANELRRLKPKKIYIVGNANSISVSVETAIKSAMKSTTVRLSGSTSGEVSAVVASEIAKDHSVDTAYIVSGANGVADALSISSKSGETKNPVLVTGKNTVNSKVFSFLKSNIDTVYYIGGINSIGKEIVSKVSSVSSSAGVNNRLSGSDRNETNVNVIKRFYKDTSLKNVVVTKSDNAGLIDTVSAGPFAASLNAPIIITGKTTIASSTSGLLNSIKSENLYQIGGGISSAVTNSVRSKLSSITNSNSGSGGSSNGSNNSKDSSGSGIVAPPSNQNNNNTGSKGIKGKTIVIDPGHGGADSGAVGLNGNREKDWTLTTSLACADYLKKAGANVIMTRKTDVYPTLQDRSQLSNDSNAVFFCSIHYNKGGSVINESTGELSGTGVEVFVGEGSLAKNVGSKVLSSILQNFNLRNRGVKDGTHLYVIRNTNAPAILVEGGFISNSKDVSLLGSASAQRTMGIQIAKGIINAFN